MSILSNEKYKGDALLQKTFCTDFLTKKMKVNEGEVPQYYVENSHPAIVSDEMFDEVQQEIMRRKQSGRQHNGTSGFAGKIFCGCCGEMYGSKVWHSNDKYRRVIWQCNGKFKDGRRCETSHLTESIIQQKFLVAMNQLLEQRDFIMEDMTAIMQQLTDTMALENEAAELHAEMDITSQLVRQLIEQNASMALDQAEYEQRYQSLSERFNKAAERVKIIEAECVRRTSQRDTMERFMNTLMASENAITEFSQEMWNALLEKMIVQENGSVKVIFKNGLEITV